LVRMGLVMWVLGGWVWDDGDGCGGVRVRAWGLRGAGGVWPSDLVGGCPTFRSVFLRRRAGFRVGGGRVAVGLRFHEEALGVWRVVVERGVDGLLEAVKGVSSVAGLWAVSAGFRWLRFRDLLPVRVEPFLPGWAGFRGGRPDLVVGPFPVELVSGAPGSRGFEEKKPVLAAYGLMLEHAWGVPVDAGFLVSLSTGRVELVCLSDSLRLRAVGLAERVEAALEEDPGLPGSPEECPGDCPFRSVCWGGSGGPPRSGGSGGDAGPEEGPGGG